MDVVDEHTRYAPARLAFAVLTASDSRSETEDRSGRRITEMAAEAGHQVVARRLVPDEADAIRAAAEKMLAGNEVDVLVVTGGTGFSPRDVSVEAVTPLLDRVVEGFGELFRALSYEQVGAAAMLSRAVAGVAGKSALFVLPGSPPAVELAMATLILPAAAHLLGQVRR